MKIRTPLACTLSAATIFAVGCASNPPETNVERVVAAAVAFSHGDPILFRVVGDAVDEPSTQPASLTILDVIRLSVLRSPELQASLARVRVAQADAQQARLLPNPILSIGLRFPEAGAGKPVIDAGIAADLLKILRRPGAISVADARLRAASAEAVTFALDVATSAQERFYAIQSLEASLGVLREREGLLQRLQDLAESRLRIGEGTRLDVVTLQTQRVELDADIADKAIELRDQRLQLARMIGQPTSDSDWTIPVWSEFSPITLTETKCLQIASERRPELQEREWELAALGAEHRLARWEVFGGTEAGINAERDGDWSFGPGASVPLPIFDTGQASRDRAMALLVESRHKLTASRRQVVEEVRRAYATLSGTHANLERVQKQLIPLQESRLKQAEAQFRAGQTDITALLIAEQDLRASKAKEIDLQHRFAVAQLNLERAIGGIGALTNTTTQPTTQHSKVNP